MVVRAACSRQVWLASWCWLSVACGASGASPHAGDGAPAADAGPAADGGGPAADGGGPAADGGRTGAAGDGALAGKGGHSAAADGGRGGRAGGSGSAGHGAASEAGAMVGSAGDGNLANAGHAGAAVGGTAGSSATASKRGLAYAIKTSGDMSALSSGISWWYNWSPKPDTDLSKVAPNVEFVPMIWGSSYNLDQLATQIPAGSKYLLTFNEPNFGSQANVTPEKAAQLWPDIQKFANDHHLKLVSPAVNYCGGSCNETSPFDWLDAFFAACKDCQVDYVAVHWYACSKSALTGYLGQFETKYGKPLWLTEFSCLDGSLPATTDNETKYMKDALAALEADPMVFRYSWFTGRSSDTPALDVLAADGKLTPLGQTYLDFKP